MHMITEYYCCVVLGKAFLGTRVNLPAAKEGFWPDDTAEETLHPPTVVGEIVLQPVLQ